MPKVSIIVPVYKTEKYLFRCIESILSQSFNDFEVIFVDDGSPDNSGRICDDYAKIDKRIKVFRKENGGVATARNEGLKRASGDYITFVDSDDYLDSEWLEQLVTAIEDNQTDLVLSGFTYVDEKSVEISKVVRRIGNWDIRGLDSKINYMISNVLYFGNGWEVCTSLFRRKIILDNQIMFCTECHNFAEDMGFMLEYLLYCDSVVATGKTGYYYIQHSGSMMANSVGRIKLDELNEVAFQFGKRFLRRTKKWRAYILLYYLIMDNQYCHVPLSGEEFKKIGYSNKVIKRSYWHDKWIRRLWICYPELVNLYGKKEARIRLLNSRLMCHHNWKLFCVESAIAYKIFIK